MADLVGMDGRWLGLQSSCELCARGLAIVKFVLVLQQAKGDIIIDRGFR
jgi:hypothetical protein